MVSMPKKSEVIVHKNKGLSNRKTAKLTGLDRGTVSEYWEEYKRNRHKLTQSGADTRTIQEELLAKPKYKPRAETAGRRAQV